MGYLGFGQQPAIRQPVHVGPHRSILLAAPAQGAPPEFDDIVAECQKGAIVGGQGVIGEEAPHRTAQLSSLFSNVLVPESPEVLRYFQQLRLFPITPCVAGQQKAAPVAIPVARSTIRFASWFESRGLLGVRVINLVFSCNPRL
jgi:hypothetical protein